MTKQTEQPRQEQKGLYQKYIITKANGKPLDDNFYAIVLRIDTGRYLRACRIGVQAFADAVRSENPTLANDIHKKLEELAANSIARKASKLPIALEDCSRSESRLRLAHMKALGGCYSELGGEHSEVTPFSRYYKEAQ